MKNFDFYESVAVLAPGSVLLFGLMQIFPELQKLQKDGITFGEFGVFLILAYVGGHLLQSVGNGVAWLWWKARSGIPSDWVRTGKHDTFVDQQRERVPAKLKELLQIDVPEGFGGMTKSHWHGITRQIYAAVDKAGRGKRVDIFNANYGMFRALVAALSILLITALVQFGRGATLACFLLVAFIVLALLRMNRFAIHYASELFVQFVSLTPSQLEGKKEAKEET